MPPLANCEDPPNKFKAPIIESLLLNNAFSKPEGFSPKLPLDIILVPICNPAAPKKSKVLVKPFSDLTNALDKLSSF